MAEMVRINTRISKQLNEWLDKRSRETGVPKSTLVFLALEQYMQQIEVMSKTHEWKAMLDQLERISALEKLKEK